MSLIARLLVVTSVVLLAFLTLTGWALDRGFRAAVEAGMRERLEAQIYMLLGTARLEQPLDRGFLPNALPDPRFSTPGSGLYSEVTDQSGQVVWRSRSLLGRRLPKRSPPQIGQWYFGPVKGGDGLDGFVSQLTVGLEALAPGRRLTFTVAEDRRLFDQQVNGFRRNLFGWLLTLGSVLLVFQQLAMRWGLAPLQRLAADLARIESGAAERLSANYPLELAGVTRNLNTLLDASRALLTRYRNALGDLAHSLKTPLAVLRATVESPPADDAELLATVNSQLERLQHTVDYQLQRAAASGRRNLLAPVQVESVLRRVVQSLEKVYADRALAFHIDCPPDCGFHGDEGDLFELTGNLLDNASKWARTRVAVRARQVEWQGQRRLNLQVDDDGPGLRGAGLQTWIERGARADTREGGQGIGLAVVAAIVEANAGGISEVSGELGGACISVWL